MIHGASVPNPTFVDKTMGTEFATLTYAGQMLYADLRADMDHDRAFAEARYQKGVRRSALVVPD